MTNLQNFRRPSRNTSRQIKKRGKRQPRYKDLNIPVYRRIASYANTYFLMTTPSASAFLQISTLPLTNRYNAPFVTFLSTPMTMRFTQPVTTVVTYRALLFKLKSRYVFSGVHDPLTYLTPQATITNFWTCTPYEPRDQAVPYKLVWDKKFVLDTTYGHDTLVTEKVVMLPKFNVRYDPDDANGYTAMGHHLLLILTNAPAADATYTFDLSFQQRYQIHF